MKIIIWKQIEKNENSALHPHLVQRPSPKKDNNNNNFFSKNAKICYSYEYLEEAHYGIIAEQKYLKVHCRVHSFSGLVTWLILILHPMGSI